ADISRLASYTVRPSPSGDNGLSAGRSKHTANGAEPQFHVLVVNQSITSCGAVMTWRSVPGGSAPGSSSGSRLPDNLAAIGTNPNYGPSYPDRKSTRLNSSHVAISYAVFCLKKKK